MTFTSPAPGIESNKRELAFMLIYLLVERSKRSFLYFIQLGIMIFSAVCQNIYGTFTSQTQWLPPNRKEKSFFAVIRLINNKLLFHCQYR